MSFFKNVLPRIMLSINLLDPDSHFDYRTLSLSILYIPLLFEVSQACIAFSIQGKQ